MISLAYLCVLFIGIAGLLTLDHRFKLAYFVDKRATVLTVLIGIIFFSLWDIAGIFLGIFFTGFTPFLSGLMLGPEYPLEEFFFLTLLSYNSLVAWRGFEKVWPRI